MTDGAGNRALLAELSKEQLLDLIELYAKNWLALDGVWFQSVEQRDGMDAAMLHDEAAWARFTVIEARRIKAFLQLPEQAGLEGLAKALRLRFYGSLNADRIEINGDTLIYTMTDCRVQSARTRKGMPLHELLSGDHRSKLCLQMGIHTLQSVTRKSLNGGYSHLVK